MKILHLCFSDGMGGAAVGARRMHQAMRSYGLDSRLLVVQKTTDDDRVIEMKRSKNSLKYREDIRRLVTKKFMRSNNPVYHSLGILPTGAHKIVNESDADIVQMHWINADTISIAEIAKINKPVVWKLPDMWAFSGAEHYKLPGDPDRYIDGYSSSNRPAHESGLDINKMIWKHKKSKWKDAGFSIVGPSRWVSDCARKSYLFKDRAVRHILNPLDTKLYRPLQKETARKEFDLTEKKKLVMFAAMHATIDTRKGFHHLKDALGKLGHYLPPCEVEFAVLGATGPEGDEVSGYAVHYLGIIRDEDRLVRAYNTADVVVFPSEMDNLPNIIKESTCCGIPCVGFDVGGMPDMITHQQTGYLAEPYDTEDLAKGIAWAVENSSADLSEKVRSAALVRHEPRVVVEQYIDFYQESMAT